jgi:hypothetical protein
MYKKKEILKKKKYKFIKLLIYIFKNYHYLHLFIYSKIISIYVCVEK